MTLVVGVVQIYRITIRRAQPPKCDDAISIVPKTKQVIKNIRQTEACEELNSSNTILAVLQYYCCSDSHFFDS